MNALENDGNIFMSNKEYDALKDAMKHSKNPLPSQTPVMAGHKDPNAPPETPFLRNGAYSKEATPVINRNFGTNNFGRHPQQQRQVGINGVIFNKREHMAFSGAAAAASAAGHDSKQDNPNGGARL